MKIGTRTLVSYTYTGSQNHNLLKQSYDNGDYVSYTYDAYRRPTKQTWEDGATVSYVYGTDGALGRMTDSATGRTTKYYYDFQGLLKQQEETGSGYSNKVRWTYSAVNNLTSQVQELNGTAYSTNYTYDLANRLSTITRGVMSGLYEYDTLSRLSKQTTRRSGNPVIEVDVTYKAGGNDCTTSGQIATWKNSRYNAVGDGSLRGYGTYSYTYNDRGNIASITYGVKTTSYVYDTKGQLTRENNEAAGKTWTYSYDAGGNILTKKEYAYTTGTLGTATSTKTYTYGNSTWKDLLTAYNGTGLSYDTVGNLTGDDTWTYTWVHGRQLAGMSKSGTTISYAYNADGQRISKTVNGTKTSYNYAGGKLTQLVKGSTSLLFSYDAVGPLAVMYNGTYYYYLRNAQGDVTGIVDANGVIVVNYSYDAWGNIRTVTGDMADTLGALNPLRYRGYVYDTETGLYYLNSRYYNPSWGRFINADIFVSTGQGILGSNMFAYCNNNPVMGYDPSGMWDWRATSDIILNGASAYAGSVVSFFFLPFGGLTTIPFTWGQFNNITNQVYYNNYSNPESALEKDPEESSYTKGYISRWDRLDYTRQETGEKTYNADAKAYFAEYSAHMYVWYAVGWADGKKVPIISGLAKSAKKANVYPHQPDNRASVRIATLICECLAM